MGKQDLASVVGPQPRVRHRRVSLFEPSSLRGGGPSSRSDTGPGRCRGGWDVSAPTPRRPGERRRALAGRDAWGRDGARAGGRTDGMVPTSGPPRPRRTCRGLAGRRLDARLERRGGSGRAEGLTPGDALPGPPPPPRSAGAPPRTWSRRSPRPRFTQPHGSTPGRSVGRWGPTRLIRLSGSCLAPRSRGAGARRDLWTEKK